MTLPGVTNAQIPANPSLNFDPFGSNLVDPNLGSGQIMLGSSAASNVAYGGTSNSVTKSTTTNTTKTTNMGKVGGDILKGVGIAAPIAIGLITMHQANKRADEAQTRAFENQQLLAALESSRQEITNPYANLSVATQAAEFQAEQADIALANTLDTLRATGAGAGGATALAQAALKSKQGISANIEQQEVKNEQLKAQGEQFVFQTREAREMQKLDRTAGLIDRDLAQEAQYRADAMGALTGGLSGASQMATALYSK